MSRSRQRRGDNQHRHDPQGVGQPHPIIRPGEAVPDVLGDPPQLESIVTALALGVPCRVGEH
eukprot:11183908-Prorocentrum_lima.AAC.1